MIGAENEMQWVVSERNKKTKGLKRGGNEGGIGGPGGPNMSPFVKHHVTVWHVGFFFLPYSFS